MKAEVIRLTSGGICEARTENELLVVFRCPDEIQLGVGETIALGPLVRDGVVNVTVRNGVTFSVLGSDVHDLRLPTGHGSSRKPSPARLAGS